MKGMRIWPCKVFLFILASDFLHSIKLYDIGPSPLKEGVLWIITALKIHHLSWA
jgi:hypothetical protein